MILQKFGKSLKVALLFFKKGFFELWRLSSYSFALFGLQDKSFSYFTSFERRTENRIWNTQFAFKSKSGTVDALFLLHCILDGMWAEKDGCAVFVVLDWLKLSIVFLLMVYSMRCADLGCHVHFWNLFKMFTQIVNLLWRIWVNN